MQIRRIDFRIVGRMRYPSTTDGRTKTSQEDPLNRISRRFASLSLSLQTRRRKVGRKIKGGGFESCAAPRLEFPLGIRLALPSCFSSRIFRDGGSFLCEEGKKENEEFPRTWIVCARLKISLSRVSRGNR